MYSYPNFIPLGPDQVMRIVGTLESWTFDRIYGAFPKRKVSRDAKHTLRASAERYLRAIGVRRDVQIAANPGEQTPRLA
jgi:histone H3/H4